MVGWAYVVNVRFMWITWWTTWWTNPLPGMVAGFYD